LYRFPENAARGGAGQPGAARAVAGEKLQPKALVADSAELLIWA
jgi:hypothetical protein